MDQRFVPLLAFILLLCAASCDENARRERSGRDTDSTQVTAPRLILEDGTLCLEGGAEPECHPLDGKIVGLRLGGEGLRLSLLDDAAPGLAAFPPAEGLVPVPPEGRGLEVRENRLLITKDGRAIVDEDLTGGQVVGLSTDDDGTLWVMTPCKNGQDIWKATGGNCSGKISVHPDPDNPQNAIIESGIGTAVIIDAFDTTNLFLRLLHPSLVPEVLTPMLEVPELLPPGVVYPPEDGGEIFLISGDEYAAGEVRSCTVPCPAMITFCNGKIIAWSTDTGAYCAIYAGNCSPKIYMNGTEVRIVVPADCPDSFSGAPPK